MPGSGGRPLQRKHQASGGAPSAPTTALRSESSGTASKARIPSLEQNFASGISSASMSGIERLGVAPPPGLRPPLPGGSALRSAHGPAPPSSREEACSRSTPGRLLIGVERAAIGSRRYGASGDCAEYGLQVKCGAHRLTDLAQGLHLHRALERAGLRLQLGQQRPTVPMITAWSAKVVTSSICRSVKGSTRRRQGDHADHRALPLQGDAQHSPGSHPSPRRTS